jgi:hypothetical protein
VTSPSAVIRRGDALLFYVEDMNLVEEFTLLAHDVEGGRIIGTTKLEYALGGALLVELALAERIGVFDGKVQVLSAAAVGNELVDGALSYILGGDRSRKPHYRVQRLGPAVRPRVLSHLVATGVLREEHSRVLWVFTRTLYPSAYGVESPVKTETISRMRAAVGRAGPVDARTAALCSLVEAAGMEHTVFPLMDRRQLRARLEEISQGDWATAAVRKAIRDVQHAVTVGGGDGGDGGGDGGGGGD